MIDPLITLDEANEHLRRDSGDDDNDVELKIQAVSQAIYRYLRPHGTVYIQSEDSNGNPLWNSGGYPVVARDSNGDPLGINPMVKAAALLYLGELYKSREGEATGLNGVAQFGTPPQSVVMLLYPLRDPVLA